MKKHLMLSLSVVFQLLISWNFIHFSTGEVIVKNLSRKSAKFSSSSSSSSSDFRLILECTGFENTEVIVNSVCPVYHQQRFNSSDVLYDSNLEMEEDQICGENNWSPTESSLRIIGGVTAGKNKYPFTVGIYVDGYYVCGGSVLSSKWVMTAAHCFQRMWSEGRDVYVEYGITDSNLDLATVRVSRYFIHPEFEICPSSIENDIALVELCHPINLSLPGVQPICLWTGNSTTFLDKVIATGWGTVNKTVAELQSHLREITLDIITNSECLDLLNETNSLLPGDNETFICTFTPGKDACWYDEGGPLIAEAPSGQLLQVGIIGMGLDCAKNDTPRTHTKVSAYKDWIVETMKTSPPGNTMEIVMECPTNGTEAEMTSTELMLNDTSSKCNADVLFGEICWSSSIAVNRVVGGQDAMPNQYPYQVALMNDSLYQCGGSIITPTWVLTAAHCVMNFDRSVREDLSVRYNTINNTHGDDVSIRRIIIHPQYTLDFTSLSNDIALIEVCQPMDFNQPGVKPICFVADDIDLTVNEVIATGWGALEERGDKSPQILQQVKLNTVSPDKCEEYYVQSSFTTVPPDNSTFVCAYAPNKDTCQGDSGGPIVAEVYPGCWIQVGIVSYGDGCARKNLPGIYTRVSAFGEWIKNTILQTH